MLAWSARPISLAAFLGLASLSDPLALTAALLGKAGSGGVGHPDLDRPQPGRARTKVTDNRAG